MHNFLAAYSWINIRFLLIGLGVTIFVSIISIFFSSIIGTVLGIIRYRKIKFISLIVGFIIDIIRNVPLILVIFFTYFGLPEIGIKTNPLWASILALIIFESMMIAEIMRAGILSIPKGQTEGAIANGLTYGQTLRHVVLPQAIKNMVPALVSQFISLVKDTSLATIIVLPELTNHAQIIYGQNTNYTIPMFLALAVMYFIICYSISKVANYYEQRVEKRLAK